MININNTRDELLSMVRKNGTIAELGVFAGEFSENILNVCNPKELILIDKFPPKDISSGNVDGNNIISFNGNYLFKLVSEKFKNNKNVKIIRDYTYIALSNFPDDYFDMIYIDADHSYEGCKRDLYIALNKLKEGGLIMCHDYEINSEKCLQNFSFGVKKAVDELEMEIIAKGMDGCVTCVIRK